MKSAKNIVLFLVLSAGAMAQQTFWPADMQIMFEGREYELKSTDNSQKICRVVSYLGNNIYEVELMKEVRGTIQGEPVYLYEKDPRKRVMLNISTWASIRELHVDSRIIRDRPSARGVE